MAALAVASHLSTEELGRRFRAARGRVERGHLQLVWLLVQGRSRGEAALLPDAGLVHEPQLDPLAGMLAREPLDHAGQGFLNRSRAFGSASGWAGRAFCQGRSSPCGSRLTPLSL